MRSALLRSYKYLLSYWKLTAGVFACATLILLLSLLLPQFIRWIIDEGIGGEPQDVPRIFMPFFRTDRSRARGTGGVGLGLALAKRIVEAHGGTIAVESRPGLGTTVSFRVPAED